ncbi:hypothetical protein BJV77DRAFT_1031053 [Russula vinacea]|nr:hypothetical protein BJV77DRAFT_1031053 [Russula vinacea]
MLNFPPPTPNPTNTAADGMPPVLRRRPEPGEPTADGPQIGAPPGWAGLMGLLFGLGLGASHELNREDPVRAKRLVRGLEAVNTGLVKRMGKIGEGNGSGAVCAICWDTLLGGGAENTPDWVAGETLGDTTSNPGQSTHPEAEPNESAEPEPEPEEPLPKIIALPCSHVFHSACLVPWFSRPKQTTCPTCRFNVDPDNLTYEPPRRPQSNSRQQPQQEPPTPPQPAVPQQGSRNNRSVQFSSTHLHSPFHHRCSLLRPASWNPVPQPQPEIRQHGPGQGPFPAPAAATDPFSPLAFQRAFHNFRRPFSPHMQARMQPSPNGVPAQEGPTLPQVPLQPQAQPPLPGQGMQPAPEDGQQNTNGMPRFPGLFQFQLPQFGRMPDGTLFWSAPLGGFPTPMNATAPQAAPGPVGPKRAWAPPPAPGLTLRQRVEQGEREKGLRCDDIGPARVVIHTVGDGVSVCGHTFHSSCLVSAERVAGWGSDSEDERELRCPVCRADGVVPRQDWEQGAQALV